MVRFSGFQIALQAAFITLLAFAAGVVVNAMSEKPLPPRRTCLDPPVTGSGTDPREPVSLALSGSEEPSDDVHAFIELDDAHQLFESGRAVLLDARSPEEYRQGHIQGAFLLPYDAFHEHFPGVAPLLIPDNLGDRTVITYCGGTDCDASIHLAEELMGMGLPRVRVFFGGWLEWQAAGYPTTVGDRP